ncbi:MAG: hypothetical protein ATN36_06890 [Epulopiscium sp. Nele67-Bin005]|nr:MAG: hypothetical protein ATN36_06890 [Epulopiscium sp. Nele67-Bin005]
MKIKKVVTTMMMGTMLCTPLSIYGNDVIKVSKLDEDKTEVQSLTLENDVVVIGGMKYLPLREIGEAIGCSVDYKRTSSGDEIVTLYDVNDRNDFLEIKAGDVFNSLGDNHKVNVSSENKYYEMATNIDGTMYISMDLLMAYTNIYGVELDVANIAAHPSITNILLYHGNNYDINSDLSEKLRVFGFYVATNTENPYSALSEYNITRDGIEVILSKEVRLLLYYIDSSSH